jgi:hypothetical protein
VTNLLEASIEGEHAVEEKHEGEGGHQVSEHPRHRGDHGAGRSQGLVGRPRIKTKKRPDEGKGREE